ncbi:MAG: class I SAM-dependent methyltransferase [Flavobacteriaceae bacterium]|nr:class I SAM-dependent methyltransferase [Flavobacteriaceae bacterium]
MGNSKENWFKSWFDSPYYHLLYQNRDEKEATFFIQNLIEILPPTKTNLLDMACGRGRHSKVFHEHGYRVTGIDLSRNNIQYAQQFKAPNLVFLERDMLIPMNKKFEITTNLFTSMGYFPNASDNWKVIQAMKNNLVEGGWGIIDFLNIYYAERFFPSEEIKTINGVKFSIRKTSDASFFYKKIHIEDAGQVFEFEEKLKKISKSEFEDCIKQEKLELLHVFGDHDLSKFDSKTSKRLIMIFKK